MELWISFEEEHTEDNGILSEYLIDNDSIDLKAMNAKLKELKKASADDMEYKVLSTYIEFSKKIKEYAKI